MPKQKRLTRKDLATFSPRHRLHGRLFSLSYSPSGGGAKYTCVVSKKVSAQAVERNLVKRRCREAIRATSKGLPPGAYVFSAKREAAKADFGRVRADVTELFSKLHDSA